MLQTVVGTLGLAHAPPSDGAPGPAAESKPTGLAGRGATADVVADGEAEQTPVADAATQNREAAPRGATEPTPVPSDEVPEKATGGLVRSRPPLDEDPIILLLTHRVSAIETSIAQLRAQNFRQVTAVSEAATNLLLHSALGETVISPESKTAILAMSRLLQKENPR